MQFRTTGLLLLGAIALPTSGATQTTPAPPAITRIVIAATKLSTVTDAPLYFKAVSVTLPSGAESEAKRPLIPTERGHRFRSKAATQSERRRPPC